MTKAEIKARDYINAVCKNLGYNCVSIYENESKELCGKTFIEEHEFFNQLESAFIAGYLSANEKCKEKSCFNCDYYNGIGWFERNDPQISCRLGGFHWGANACDEYKQIDFESDEAPF